ncbi:unnamed protein product [Spirodela intermedia]|uniref:Kinesin motor domain-containing protein n=1 Tax=Spirodela intermedia TaxID=51605 RepID=A0A7I8JT38_SPIIN|nr:unnamed protein product [Spirodela intermedia]CAA6673274.1 unnamed protein product [Spirodela intermedia]
MGHRDFSLDGVSVAGEGEGLEGFYKRFVESRIASVKSGGKCTIMMYGPTGSGKSHTMFGCINQPGIVYRALRDILRRKEDCDDGGGIFVQVAVLEIYNEEIYDLLPGTNGPGPMPGSLREARPRGRRNASFICGNEAEKISREVAKVEKRRIVRSTLCNERSSRSHCLIILDVPSVGGRLMLVDMAGSENIEQAGQSGLEAKLQTGKINQGNIALKRVVESIANGDSHVPFRDSKLTLLLQDSFEDDKSKILMILCASPDPREIHKTVSTLEYGAKAKCIVRAPHMANPCRANSQESSSLALSARIVAMNQFISKLQTENKVKGKELDQVNRELVRKEGEVADLRAKLTAMELRGKALKEEEIRSIVDERTLTLRLELEKMEAKVQGQEEELGILRQHLGDEERGKGSGRAGQNGQMGDDPSLYLIGGRFMNRLSELYSEGDAGMEKSMELDTGDYHQPPCCDDVKEIREDPRRNHPSRFVDAPCCLGMEEDDDIAAAMFTEKVLLSTVFEANEEEEESEGAEQEVVEKEVVEDDPFSGGKSVSSDGAGDADSARRTRIHNIFRLCGSHRDLGKHAKIFAVSKPETAVVTPELESQALPPPQHDSRLAEGPVPSVDDLSKSLLRQQMPKRNTSSEKENDGPAGVDALQDVYVKWEASSGDSSGNNLIKKLKVLEDSNLAELRKLIEAQLDEMDAGQEEFTFLSLRESEATFQVSKLPARNNLLGGYLACLRPTKTMMTQQSAAGVRHLPFSPLENRILVDAVTPLSKIDDCFFQTDIF